MKNKKENWEEIKKGRKGKKTLSRTTNTTAQGYFLIIIFLKHFSKEHQSQRREYLVNSAEIYLRPVSSTDYTEYIRDRVEQHKAKELNFIPSDYGKITFLLGFV